MRRGSKARHGRVADALDRRGMDAEVGQTPRGTCGNGTCDEYAFSGNEIRSESFG